MVHAAFDDSTLTGVHINWSFDRMFSSFIRKEFDVDKNWELSKEEQKSIRSEDLDYLPYLYISRSLLVLGQEDPESPYNDAALAASTRALEISPAFIRTFYEVAQAHLNKKEFDKAIEILNEAIDLNPDVGISWWYLWSLLRS